jgi:hypothetical protein
MGDDCPGLDRTAREPPLSLFLCTEQAVFPKDYRRGSQPPVAIIPRPEASAVPGGAVQNGLQDGHQPSHVLLTALASSTTEGRSMRRGGGLGAV